MLNRSRSQVLLLIAAAAALAGGCAGTPVPTPANAAARSASIPPMGVQAALLARQAVGVPYQFGGADPTHGFDCSGLVYWSYRQVGIQVPRTSQELFKTAEKIALRDAAAGDIVFFQDQTQLSHVGIYLGAGWFVHAPSAGRSVTVASIEDPYYQQQLVAVGRLVDPQS
jgi:cell wall-associated NlpC family hydrolase